VGRWLGGRERRCPRVVRQFIDRPPPELTQLARSRQRSLEPRGRCYSLERILKEVNETYFDGAVAAGITWGRRGPRRRVQVRTLGSYCRHEDLIVINPVLDQWAVPEWFVSFTVYHECLHSRQSPEERPHNRTFREALRRHPHYGEALRWEKANLPLLTRGRDVGPMRQAAYRTRRGRPPHRQLGFNW